MSETASIVLMVVVLVGVVGILIYLAFEKRILFFAETRKQNKAFKANRKILEMLYDDIMFKKSVLEEDEELTQILESYPYLSAEIEEYRQFRNSCFTGEIIKRRDDYNRYHNNGGQQ